MSKKIIINACALMAGTFLISNAAYADFGNPFASGQQMLAAYTLDCAHWYVGGSFGWSHFHDQSTFPNGSIKNAGPGWETHFGYQWNSMWGTELGFNQYYYSREERASSSAVALLAKTEHFSYDLAATARYPLAMQWSVSGKLGVAYSHARKIALGIATNSSGSVSAFYGLGLDWSVTPRADLIVQWNRARGNNYTGSSDLCSVGFNVALA